MPDLSGLSASRPYVKVVKGDTLSEIAALDEVKEKSGNASWGTLAAINNISNPDYIVVDQIIYLTKKSGGGVSSLLSNLTQSVTIQEFGRRSIENPPTLLCTWDWKQKGNTEKYEIRWEYIDKDGVWLVGKEGSTTYMYSTYEFPATANEVRFKVKPVSVTKMVNNKETTLFKGSFTGYRYYTVVAPPDAPTQPQITIDENLELTASVDNIDSDASIIEFDVVKDDTTWVKSNQKVKVTETNTATYKCKISAGGSYKVRCRAKHRTNNAYSEWSQFSNSEQTVPSAPSKFTKCMFHTKSSVYLEWGQVKNTESYVVEYTTKKSYFDNVSDLPNKTTTKTSIIIDVDPGNEYFFRVKATNAKGSSGWSEISSAVIGTLPSAPTTWSSSTTVKTGERLTLYWVHNSEDNSTQTWALVAIKVNDAEEWTEHFVENTNSQEDKDKNLYYEVDTTAYGDGAKLTWKVCTAGLVEDPDINTEEGSTGESSETILSPGERPKVFGKWSVERVVDIYREPSFSSMEVTNAAGDKLGDGSSGTVVLTSFPIKVSASTEPANQQPIGYHLSITAETEEGYDTVDNLGNDTHVIKGQEVYSKFFNADSVNPSVFYHELSASDVDLENGQTYKLHFTASMNSGLDVPPSERVFVVAWSETDCVPNAEFGFDPDNIAVSIAPYCTNVVYKYYKVSKDSNSNFTATTQVLDGVYGEPVKNGKLATGEQVYHGVSDEGVDVYYYLTEEEEVIKDENGNEIEYLMSIYRREYDGSFTLIESNMSSLKRTTAVDPHPALDYARYRIVAQSEKTGAITYYDMPGYPIEETSVIIQWDEQWSSYDYVGSDDELVKPDWTGSMLKLPYNIDVSDQYSTDVEFVKYIGRKHPVSYYGTHLGESSIWSVEVPKDDRDTLYALRRLAIWMGNVYVREPSGSGYWANVSVSFDQKHCELTIPVSLFITRVEGGA